jgi:hypothetical protein
MSGLDLIRELEGELKRLAHVDLTLVRIVKSYTCELGMWRCRLPQLFFGTSGSSL